MSNFINQLREKVALYKLDKLLKRAPHKRKTHNLKTAQTAGILYDAEFDNNHKLAKELIKELSEYSIKTEALGFINKSKRDDNYIGDQTYSFACKKDFSFFYSIKKDSIQSFIDKPFNLLFVLTNKQLFVIDYLAKASKSEFKVGKANINNDLYDLMIELKSTDDLAELKKQMIHYLNLLNNN